MTTRNKQRLIATGVFLLAWLVGFVGSLGGWRPLVDDGPLIAYLGLAIFASSFLE